MEPPNRLMTVEVSAAGGFRAGAPRLLFELPQEAFQGGRLDSYAVHPSGERILLPLATAPEETPALRLVLAWPELLHR